MNDTPRSPQQPRIEIQRDYDAFGYFVRVDSRARAFRFTLWGARRVARRILRAIRNGTYEAIERL